MAQPPEELIGCTVQHVFRGYGQAVWVGTVIEGPNKRNQMLVEWRYQGEEEGTWWHSAKQIRTWVVKWPETSAQQPATEEAVVAPVVTDSDDARNDTTGRDDAHVEPPELPPGKDDDEEEDLVIVRKRPKPSPPKPARAREAEAIQPLCEDDDAPPPPPPPRAKRQKVSVEDLPEPVDDLSKPKKKKKIKKKPVVPAVVVPKKPSAKRPVPIPTRDDDDDDDHGETSPRGGAKVVPVDAPQKPAAKPKGASKPASKPVPSPPERRPSSPTSGSGEATGSITAAVPNSTIEPAQKSNTVSVPKHVLDVSASSWAEYGVRGHRAFEAMVKHLRNRHYLALKESKALPLGDDALKSVMDTRQSIQFLTRAIFYEGSFEAERNLRAAPSTRHLRAMAALMGNDLDRVFTDRGVLCEAL